MEDLTIEQHEAQINGIEDQVKILRATQLEHHSTAEVKRSRVPIKVGPLDQAVTPGTDFAAWMKGLPQAAIDFIRGSK